MFQGDRPVTISNYFEMTLHYSTCSQQRNVSWLLIPGFFFCAVLLYCMSFKCTHCESCSFFHSLIVPLFDTFCHVCGNTRLRPNRKPRIFWLKKFESIIWHCSAAGWLTLPTRAECTSGVAAEIPIHHAYDSSVHVPLGTTLGTIHQCHRSDGLF